MRAVQIFETGGPEVLQQVDLPTPHAAEGEVRVKTEAIGVGRPDVLVRKGIYKWMPPLPTIPGSELVGIVDELGSGVPAALKGKRVLVSARELAVRGGCCAEYMCVPAAAVFELPESINPIDAVSLPNLQFVNALWRSNGERPVRSIYIPGVSGGVGSTLTQFARYKGAQVIGSTSTPEKTTHALDNGVHHIVKGDSQSLPQQIMDVTQGQGVDLAVDQLGGDSLIACLRSLAPMGMVVSINVILGLPNEDVFNEMRNLLTRSLAIRTFSMHTFDVDVSVRRSLMNDAIAQMANGDVKAPPAKLLKMTDIQLAHQWLEAGSSMGKIVIQP